MEPSDNYSSDNTCSKTGMPAFGQASLSYKKLSYVKIARVNALTNKFDKVYSKSQTSEPPYLAWPGSSRQLMFILMAANRMFKSSQVSSIHIEALQSREVDFIIKRRK